MWQKISWGETWIDFCYASELSSLTERCGKELRELMESVGAGSMARSMDRDGKSKGEDQGLGFFFLFFSIFFYFSIWHHKAVKRNQLILKPQCIFN